MESQIDMVFERETKNFWVYKQVDGGINKSYLTKYTDGRPAPKSITMIVQVNQQ